ncbi:D-glycero-beta-D-manno-heptose-7-phosphate kinase [Desulfohalobium retbaense]|uniref:RfaE bifunctional protein n=1 Tax=Desulfohalobium retbaense (strain ATCC 49708 / DSM 5692 / JCM 16813 / HR100) TaxID=485915 RepID=C8WZ32_DESRD|nr:D-glycero-beta-D-manno-heptose-7-phosphate kinase [Desulfohalobium retbaense]ACV67307.1 rfaE bifunctional protein [Desulfohalobium retbaense DSM 5692]
MPNQLTSSLLEGALPRLHGKRVLVVGDVMLDHYQQGSVERISPEAPVPVVHVESEEYRLGGAGNVARNIKSLGGEPTLLSCVGRDAARERLTELLKAEAVQHSLISDPHWRTTRKTRVMAAGQQIVRIDHERMGQARDSGRERFAALVGETLPDFDVVILSDYGKGALDHSLLEAVRRKAHHTGAKILIDPKIQNFHLYAEPYLITPNRKEAGEGAGMRVETREDVLMAGRRLLRRNNCANVLITLGGDGMALFLESGEVWHLPTSGQKVFDVTGAGDTVIGVTALGLSAGLELAHACALANFAAGVVVAQVGAASVTAEELGQTLQEKHGLAFSRWE